MRTRTARLASASVVVAALGCGDDASELENKRFTELTSNDRLALCRKWEDETRKHLQELMTIACTDEGRYAMDQCEQTRAGCVAKIPNIDFDFCASPDASTRVTSLFATALAGDPDLADVAAALSNMPSGQTVAASCPLTVKTWEDCFVTQSEPLARAALEYTCQQGDEAADFPVSTACHEYGNIAAMCTAP